MENTKSISKGHLFLALTALFLSSMCTLGDLVINPIVNDLYAAFSDAPVSVINFGITGPALVGLPFCILAGRLCDKYNKKIVMVIGFAIFTCSAVFGAAVENIYYFVIMRCLATGVGWGVTNTAAYAIMATLYQDEVKHGKIVGWYNSAMSLIGAALASVSGILAVSAWQNAFKAYWVSIPVLAMLIIFLPSMKPDADIINANGKDENKPAEQVNDSGWWKPLIPLSIQVFGVALCAMVFLYMVSLYVADAGIGDGSLTGVISSINTLATAAMSLVFGYCYKKMKSAVYLPAIFIISIAFIVMGLVPTKAVAMVSAVFIGGSWAFYFCYFYARCVDLVPPHRAGTATGIVALADGIAATGCSYFLTGLMSGLGINAVQAWPIIGATLGVISVISLVWYIATRKKAA